LASDVAQQISALAPDQLLDLSDALLDFTSSADLMAWLAAPSASGTGDPARRSE
jgi:hypothetical protein